MKKIINVIGALWRCWYYIWVATALIVVALTYVLLFWLPYGYRVKYTCAMRRNVCYCALLLTGIWISRKKLIRLHSSALGPQCIVVANHKSDVDILILAAIAPGSCSFVAKNELSKVPLLGWVISQLDVIVDRGKQGSYDQMLLRAKQLSDIGQTIIIFPEGTRNGKDLVNEFKIGAWKLSRDLQLSMTPILLPNSNSLIPNKQFFAKPGITKPVFNTIFFPYGKEPVEEYMGLVHEWFMQNK